MRRPLLLAASRCLLPLLALTIAACSETPDDAKFAPACPALSLLQDADNLTRFSGNGHDITEMRVAARITAVPAKCMRADATHVRAVLSVDADVLRGPAAGRDAFNVRYFVAVTEGGHVLQEQDFALPAQFRAQCRSGIGEGRGHRAAAARHQEEIRRRLSRLYRLPPDGGRARLQPRAAALNGVAPRGCAVPSIAPYFGSSRPPVQESAAAGLPPKAQPAPGNAQAKGTARVSEPLESRRDASRAAPKE